MSPNVPFGTAQIPVPQSHHPFRGGTGGNGSETETAFSLFGGSLCRLLLRGAA